MSTEIKTMELGEIGNLHRVGYKECDEGWCDRGTRYPRKCECGGLIHAEFGDENYDCDYWLYTKCDKCGESE